MTGDDVTVAAGFFNQPSSVALLIEAVETAAAKATFFFGTAGKCRRIFRSWISRSTPIISPRSSA
jgi:hypothetical protein